MFLKDVLWRNLSISCLNCDGARLKSVWNLGLLEFVFLDADSCVWIVEVAG